jgi:hypothetical protein
MNPLETVENDKMLTSILKGLTSMWHYQEDFLVMVVYFTRDYDTASEVVELFSEHDLGLEEALFEKMTVKDFKANCVGSEFLDIDKCNELIEQLDE